jgi:hypothetical protein
MLKHIHKTELYPYYELESSTYYEDKPMDIPEELYWRYVFAQSAFHEVQYELEALYGKIHKS